MRLERHDITNTLINVKYKEETFVCPYMGKVKNYINSLVKMGGEFPEEFAIYMILISHPDSYKSFVTNLHLKNHNVTLMELSSSLEAEKARIIKM